MDESGRRTWLNALFTNQLRALCHVAEIYDLSADWGREAMIDHLCLVEDIEKPRETCQKQS